MDDVSSSSSSISPRISFSDSERESVEDKSVREELGPGIGESPKGDRGVSGEGEDGFSGVGGGADSERSVGGGIDGTANMFGAGICDPFWSKSDLPITSLIAARSNPAVLGMFDASGVPISP